jgi:hypothetical protein
VITRRRTPPARYHRARQPQYQQYARSEDEPARCYERVSERGAW